MKEMTRSDIILEINRAKTIEQKDELIRRLHYKIEQAYTILFSMEEFKDKNDKAHNPYTPLAELLRKALEA